MKVQVLDKNGKKIEDLTLKPNVFGVAPNEDLISQYLRVFGFNQRQGNASTKDRGEVSGSGKKPWRQKGTGNARVGSKRTPIWRHGGTVHGPKPKSWRLDFPKRMRRKSLLIALSDKLAHKNLIIINELNLEKPSTKEVEKVLENLKIRGKSLVVLDENNKDVIKSFANITSATTAFWDNLNTYAVLDSNNLLLTKEAVLKIQEKYENK